METPLLRVGFKRAIARCHAPARRRTQHLQPSRQYATPTEGNTQGDFRAAPPISFTSDPNQFSALGSNRKPQRDGKASSGGRQRGRDSSDDLLRRVRVVPASPSYFTATPYYTDDLLHLASLLRRHQLLPVLAPGFAPRVAWKTYANYKTEVMEPVKAARYNRILELLKRLNYIHPSVMPSEVSSALERFKRSIQPHLNQPKPIVVDRDGKSRAVGRRKESSAVCFVVEGEGECMVNGRSLSEYFARLHDRESALWALKATQRLDKYNVWVVVRGGGTTGQAEAITLGVAKALLAHEPDLKPALRRGKLILSDNIDLCLLTHFHSWLHYTRSAESRKKEARQAESQEDACLGETIEQNCNFETVYVIWRS